MNANQKPHQLGWGLIGGFLGFGAAMLAFTATMLACPDMASSKVF